LNIFVLDRDVRLCAQYHNNKHVVKMILESTQLLNNALSNNESSYIPVYRKTHVNHPASLWTSESLSNFKWLNSLAIELCYEYTFRYGKTHKCQSILENFSNFKFSSFEDKGMTDFALCMPDDYKVTDPVESYRNYYLGSKRDLAKWDPREQPYWWK
jgi:hypothetical protein